MGFLISFAVSTLLILYVNRRLATSQQLPSPWGYTCAAVVFCFLTIKCHLWAHAGINNASLGHFRIMFLPGFLLEYFLLWPATATTAVVGALVWVHHLGRASQQQSFDSGFEQRMQEHFSEQITGQETTQEKP